MRLPILAAASSALMVLAGCAASETDPGTEPTATTQAAERDRAPADGGIEKGDEKGIEKPVDDRPPPFVPSDGTPRDARVSIPRLDIAGLPVRSYRGVTDDAAGEAIQDTGIAASPHGPAGGTGPGGVGNYLVGGHRTSATRVFELLPELRRGDRVLVRAGDVEYVYRISTTRITSFRSPQSLREQRADVPGDPGRMPTRAMITLSTCRTIEDHAEGNYWSDELGNPEHRIDKIGTLVRSRTVG